MSGGDEHHHLLSVTSPVLLQLHVHVMLQDKVCRANFPKARFKGSPVQVTEEAVRLQLAATVLGEAEGDAAPDAIARHVSYFEP